MAVAREIKTAGGAVVRICDGAYAGAGAEEIERRRARIVRAIDRIWEERARAVGARMEAGALTEEDARFLSTIGARKKADGWVFPEEPPPRSP